MSHKRCVQVGFAVFRRQDMGGAPKTLVTLSFAYCLPGAPAGWWACSSMLKSSTQTTLCEQLQKLTHYGGAA